MKQRNRNLQRYTSHTFTPHSMTRNSHLLIPTHRNTFVGEVHGQSWRCRGRVHARRDYRGGVHDHRVELVVPVG